MPEALCIGYVVKRYPRFSETFIVNEILAHERAGVPVEIFAVRRVNEPYFQGIIADVRAPVTYIHDGAPKAESLWQTMGLGAAELPDFWRKLSTVTTAEVGDVQQAIQLALAARRKGVTHFHAHFATVATRITQLAAHFSGIGFSFTGHAKDLFHEGVDVPALRSAMMDADAVVTVSDFNRQWLRRQHGSLIDRVVRIYNGLRLDDFPFHSPEARPRRIVAVGRLVEKKGFDVLVEACGRLREGGAQFHCDIIGEGPMRTALELRIAELGLASHVSLLGARPRAEVTRSFVGAAVATAPCIVAADGDRDGLPTVVLEAMALGTPCVTTDVTGLPEVIRSGETGLCVAQNDVDALAQALLALLDDPALRVRLATGARALIEAEFDVDRNAVALRRLFHGTDAQTLRAVS